MNKQRVFLDANVIIEAFRISVWTELSQGCHLETVQECESEALTGSTTSYGHISVNAQALTAGLKQSHLVGKAERQLLFKAHKACTSMDPGERDLFAHLFANFGTLPSLIVVSTADKGVVVRAKDFGWLQNLVSLEDLLHSCKVSPLKLKRLDVQFHDKFLTRVRTNVIQGVIP